MQYILYLTGEGENLDNNVLEGPISHFYLFISVTTCRWRVNQGQRAVEHSCPVLVFLFLKLHHSGLCRGNINHHNLPPCTDCSNENKTLSDAHSPRQNLSITVTHLVHHWQDLWELCNEHLMFCSVLSFAGHFKYICFKCCNPDRERRRNTILL